MSTEKSVKFIKENELINKYLKEVRKHDVLTDKEEKQLFEQYINGDMSARDKIIMANQRFLYSQAKIYAVDSEDILDYVSEGNIGMLEAFEEFDHTKGFKFITFAVWYIKRAMNNYMTNQRDSITKSNNAKFGKKIDKIKNDFFSKNERYPYPDEIAAILMEKYNIEVVNLIDLYDLEIESINSEVDNEVNSEDSSEFAIKTAEYNEYDVEREESSDDKTIDLTNNLLNLLSERRQDIIMKYFGINGKKYSIVDLSLEYQMNEDIIKKIINDSLKYMRQEYNKNPQEYDYKTQKAQ